MKAFIDNYLELPNRLKNLLIIFLDQNEGKLSKRARSNEFVMLTEQEVLTLETNFKEIFL